SYPAAVTEVSQVSGAYLMADGKYLVYGDFKKNNGITKPGIIRFNADGTVDNTFNIGSGPNAAVETVAVQPDGKILIGGRFTTFNGVSRKILARLNSDGTLDNTFNPNIVINNTGTEANVLIQPDGKILFTGQVFSVDGFSTGSTLFRFNSNGTVDATFSGPSYGYQIQAMARQADGKIILVGSFTKGIVRLTTTGAVDATFDVGTGFESLVSTVQVTSTNQIIVGGHFATYKGAAANNLVCLTTTGAIDATWQGNAKPNGGVNDSYLLPDGKLLIAGYFSSYNSTSSKSLARLNTNGTLDGTLVVGTGANGGLQTIHANATGDIIVTGSTPTFSSYNGTSRTGGVAVLQSNGTLKSMTEQPKFHQEAWVRTIIEQGSNKYLIGHFGTEVNGTPAANLARLNADGTLDATFNGNGKPNLYVDAITVDRNGKILIGGAFTSYNGTNAARFTRLSADGTLESTFNTTLGTGFNGNVNVIAEQPDGKILVGGSFSTFNGGSKKALIRLNEDGTPDAAFNTSNGFSTSTGSTQIFDIEIQADGKILVGGEFSAFGVNAVKNLIRLNADGTFDNTFNIGAGVYASGSSSVNAITILSNGKILAGGYIRTANTGTNNVNYLALLSSTGAVENGYISNNFFFVEALKKQSDGKVLVVDRNSGLRRLNSDGSIDNTFTTLTFDYFERGVAILGNSLIAAGRLALAENKVVMGLAKYDIPAAAPTAPTVLTTTTVGQTTVDLSWTHTGTTESGFFVERSTGNNTSYTTIATLAANTTTYSNTGLTANTQYYYRVRAFNATGISAYSNELNTTTLNPIPAAPTNLSLTVISAGEIRINWTDASTNESGFEIHRSTSNNTSYSLLTTTSANAVTYSDLTVSQGVTYYYKIRSINNGGPSAFTTEQSAVAINPPPIAPTNLVLTSTSSSTIVITWTDNAFNEVDYIIERGTNSFSNLTELVVLPANTTEYTDATVTFGQSYAYRVRARNANGTSTELLSAVTAGTFLMGNKTITTCQGKIYDSGFGGNYGNNENSTLKLLPSTAGSALQLVFSSFSTEAADQLRIYDGETITDPLIGTYSGTTLPGTIRATNSAGALTLVFTSNATTVSTGWAIDLTCGVFPKNPTNLELAVPNLSEVKLNWTDNATNEVAYVIERSLTGSTADFTSLVTVAANSTSYSDN
ncbi:MAG TPA: fibronectin type III domain-containing protein, partial [Sphingobacteriaceae bacterium]